MRTEYALNHIYTRYILAFYVNEKFTNNKTHFLIDTKNQDIHIVKFEFPRHILR